MAVIINRSAAEALFADEEPLGRHLQMGHYPGNPNPLMTVVGVVGDVRQSGLDQEAPAQMYAARSQAGSIYGGLGSRLATLAVRTEDSPEAAASLVREAIRALDANLPVASVTTLEETVSRSVGDRRFVSVLVVLFAGLTVVLGAVGLYGLMAYVVSARTREIGIRYALGAERATVLRAVLSEAAALVIVGALIGVLAAATAGGVLESMAYDVGGRDPIALAGASALLLITALLAATVPARRALGIDPTEALRAD
jgi:ABC-type lipoprotein release transport system permease subunit